MKKMIVFISMFLLVFMLSLVQIDEADTQQEETTDEALATAHFTIRPGSSFGRGWRDWWKHIQFPGGQVIRVEVTSVNDGNIYVNDLEVISNSTIKIHGRWWSQGWLRRTPFLRATVRIDYLSEPPLLTEDVSGDGVVNVQDLVFVANHFGPSTKKYRVQNVRDTFVYESSRADVNTDGVVNILDMVLIAGALGGEGAAPSAHPQSLGMLSASDVQNWLLQARQLVRIDVPSQKGIAVLEQLLSVLTSQKTELLPNYPNPFNPETWIPYHLAEPADVTLTIYSVDGKVVRGLDLGHQAAGYYQNKSRAAYWDGRNNVGERVASGLYFYTLTAGDFAATRKMLILK